MASCSCCGSMVPDDQVVCSMCYGDIDHGNDGYYREWAEKQMRQSDETEAGERERIASRLEIRAAGGCNARAYITDPNCAARGRTVENWCSNCLALRAANLLRTEPGGEREEVRNARHEAARIVRKNEGLEGYCPVEVPLDVLRSLSTRRPSTPVEEREP